MQLGFRYSPGALYGDRRNVQDFCDFVLGQASKEAQLHYPALPRVELGQFVPFLVRGLVQRNQIDSLLRDHRRGFVQSTLLPPPRLAARCFRA